MFKTGRKYGIPSHAGIVLLIAIVNYNMLML
jgi:hypothetical protein